MHSLFTRNLFSLNNNVCYNALATIFFDFFKLFYQTIILSVILIQWLNRRNVCRGINEYVKNNTAFLSMQNYFLTSLYLLIERRIWLKAFYLRKWFKWIDAWTWFLRFNQRILLNLIIDYATHVLRLYCKIANLLGYNECNYKLTFIKTLYN